MTTKKEAVEITCESCSTRFRLWIPEELLSEWGEGEEIGCIKCSARFVVKLGSDGVEATPVGSGGGGTEQKSQVLEGTRIIFVDDDKLATAIAENTVSEICSDFEVAAGGEEALEKIGGDDYSLVISDLHLADPEDPEKAMDGEEFLRKVAETGKNIPAIIITGKDIIDDIALDPKWFDLNVKGFVQKGNPFWAEELKDKVKEVLGVI